MNEKPITFMAFYIFTPSVILDAFTANYVDIVYFYENLTNSLVPC